MRNFQDGMGWAWERKRNKMLKGHVVRILKDKQFGFIRYKGVDYFLHITEFKGDWNELCDLVESNPKVTFEGMKTPKGMRAIDVRLEN
jgi:cold shock CspA family protein